MSDRCDETWHRLIEWTYGQAPSERLAAQLLLSVGFQGLDPSHPLGGKDGGKDAICWKEGKRFVMAVYFPRGQQTIAEIKKKFSDDLQGVLANQAEGMVFVTNQELRLAEREDLIGQAQTAGVTAEIFHLERNMAILDSPPMHSVRKQFLHIDFDNEPAKKSQQERAKAYEIVLPRTLNIAGQAEGMLRELGKASQRTVELDTIDRSTLDELCQAVDPNAPAPIILGGDPQQGWQYGSWLFYLNYWRQRSHRFFEDIAPFFSFLEAEHMVLLTQVDQCSYFRQLDMLVNTPIRNQDVSWLASTIWDYIQLARQLKTYASLKQTSHLPV